MLTSNLMSCFQWIDNTGINKRIKVTKTTASQKVQIAVPSMWLSDCSRWNNNAGTC